MVLFAQLLVSNTTEELGLKHGTELTKQVRTFNALYRLSFRHASRMHLSDGEISLVVDYVLEAL